MIFSDENRIFSLSPESNFYAMALEIFRYQAENNPVYGEYISARGIEPGNVSSIKDIPFLPISLFKSRKVVCGDFTPEKVFRSSGTAGMEHSLHYLYKLSLYEESFLRSFSMFYGDPAGITLYALLPSYLERKDSSLVYMADRLIAENREGRGGFFLDNYRELTRRIEGSLLNNENVFLLGVSFALLNLAEIYAPDLSGLTLIETGGMKGRRKELVRQELHSIFKERMNVKTVHSEYGMTELLSQAWSKGEGIFYSPPWMRVLTRDPLDPLSSVEKGGRGAINIIDLANIYSCSFIETADLGILHDNGSFEVSGRFDNSDVRGCNLLI